MVVCLNRLLENKRKLLYSLEVSDQTPLYTGQKTPTLEENMSPEAIKSLIQMFGVEKGLHILNLFTAMDDTELSHQQKRRKPITKDLKKVKKDIGLSEKPAMEQAAD